MTSSITCNFISVEIIQNVIEETPLCSQWSSIIEQPARRFKSVLAETMEISAVVLEMSKAVGGANPPMQLEGRAVFRSGESNSAHTSEAVNFSDGLTTPATSASVASGLQEILGIDLGDIYLKATGPATLHQDVMVMLPTNDDTKRSKDLSFFEENPEVLAAAVVLAALLLSILITAWWYILRYEHSRNFSQFASFLSVLRLKFR